MQTNEAHDRRPRTMKLVWDRSIPVQRRLSGADHTVLRKIRDLCPALRIMWDAKRQMVTIWQIHEDDGKPWFVKDNPFGPFVDNRLFVVLNAGDLRRNFSTREYLEAVDRGKAAKDAEAKRKSFEHVDTEAFAYQAMRSRADDLGERVGLQIAVPAQIGPRPDAVAVVP